MLPERQGVSRSDWKPRFGTQNQGEYQFRVQCKIGFQRLRRTPSAKTWYPLIHSFSITLMTSQLNQFRSRLHSLRRQRSLDRWGSAWCVFALLVLLVLLLAFFADWSLRMSRPQRFVMLVASVGAGYWVLRRFTLPSMGRQEADVDLALELQQRHGIDSDLVASLQFETDEAARWGSRQLETVVIDQTAVMTDKLDVFAGFSWNRLRRRAVFLGVAAIVLLIVTAVFPQHIKSFLNRFLLGSAHYPTRTQIESITVNGHDIEIGTYGNRSVNIPYGRMLKFELQCAGELPKSGRVELTGIDSQTASEFALESNGSQLNEKSRSFSGQLLRLIESVTCQVHIGDAWTEPLRINVIPLPIVDVELKSTPPKYAVMVESESSTEDKRRVSARQIAVLEGTRVDLNVVSRNKPLTQAMLTLNEQEFQLKQQDEDGNVWSMADETALASITEPMRYEIQVVDHDGLSLERPIQGTIRLKTDRRPRVSAAMVSRRVVPTGRPQLVYGATDDFGLARLRVHFQIYRGNGDMEQIFRDLRQIDESDQPVRTLRDRDTLDLEPLKLVKGDELKITLEATDYRGTIEPKSVLSEPIILEITDREGILAELLESDEKSVRQLDEIIQRELGIGGTR